MRSSILDYRELVSVMQVIRTFQTIFSIEICLICFLDFCFLVEATAIKLTKLPTNEQINHEINNNANKLKNLRKIFQQICK